MPRGRCQLRGSDRRLATQYIDVVDAARAHAPSPRWRFSVRDWAKP